MFINFNNFIIINLILDRLEVINLIDKRGHKKSSLLFVFIVCGLINKEIKVNEITRSD